MRFEIDSDLCQGHGKCYLSYPDRFAPDDDDDWGRSKVIQPAVAADDPGALADARAVLMVCPEVAIKLVE